MLRTKLLLLLFYSFSFLGLWICLDACSGEQAAPDSFIKFFGGAYDQKANAFKADADGKLMYIVGSTESFGNGKQIFLIKTDQNGNQLWDIEKGVYGSQGDDEGRDVGVLPNGNVLILGYATDSFGNQDMILLELNQDGDSLRSYFYGLATAQEEGFYMNITENRVTLIGTRTLAEDNQPDMYVVTLDYEDNSLKTAINESYGLFDTREEVGNILETPNGKLLWCSTIFRGDKSDIRLVMIDKNGNIESVKTFGEGNDHSESGKFIQAYEGGYVIVGNRDSEDIIRVMIDAQGNFQTNESDALLSPSVVADAQTIYPVSDGGFIIAGTQRLIENTDSQMLLLKISSSGEVLWSSTFGSQSRDDQISLDRGQLALETADKGFLFLGTIHFGNNDVMALIKTDSFGNALNK